MEPYVDHYKVVYYVLHLTRTIFDLNVSLNKRIVLFTKFRFRAKESTGSVSCTMYIDKGTKRRLRPMHFCV